MKQIKYLYLAIYILLSFPNYAIAGHIVANLGKFGIMHYSNIEDYQRVYLGKTVKYVPSHDWSKDSDFGGSYNVEYVVSKISGKNSKMTWTLQEKNNFYSTVKLTLYNQFVADDLGKNEYCISSGFTIPLVVVDEIKKEVKSLAKERFPENEDYFYTLTDIKFGYEYSILYELTNNYTGGKILVDNINKIEGIDQIGKTITTENGKKFKIIEFDNFEKKSYKLKNEKTGDIKSLKKEYFKALSKIGHKFTHPKVKANYKIEDIQIIEKDEKETRILYIVSNSEDQKLKVVSSEPECFEEDLEGHYNATLSSVQKPADSSIRYGKTKTITDKGITMFGYEDKYINIILFVSDNQFNFVLKNVSQNSLKIVWNEAAYVNSNGISSKIMHTGIRYSEKEADQLATTIISGAKIDDAVCPTNNVRYSETSHKYITDNIFPSVPALTLGPIKLMLPIQVKNVINEYIFVFDVNYVYDHPERLNL